MKKLFVIILMIWVGAMSTQAQDTVSICLADCYVKTRGLKSISISYFGEMITHPGVKVGFNYPLKVWTRHKAKKSEKKNEDVYVSKSFTLSGSVGSGYHKRYQSTYFALLEPKHKIANRKGFFMEVGLGVGYMRTFTPSVYFENADIKKKYFFNDYFISSVSLAAGKNYRDFPIGWFVKPQFIYAIPNFPSGVGYFALELGASYRLKSLR